MLFRSGGCRRLPTRRYTSLATNETSEKLPLVLSHRIVKRVDDFRKSKLIKGILPDGKAQVTVEYEDGKPTRVKTIVFGFQNWAEIYV